MACSCLVAKETGSTQRGDIDSEVTEDTHGDEPPRNESQADGNFFRPEDEPTRLET